MTSLEELHRRAREMRRNPTEPEKRFWRGVSNSQLSGYKFRRQQVIGYFIVDFFCPAFGLIVEIDGDTHDQPYDDRRDAFMAAHGFDTIRFTNLEVMGNIEGVLEATLAQFKGRHRRTQWRLPHPNPAGPQPCSPNRAEGGPDPEGEGLQR